MATIETKSAEIKKAGKERCPAQKKGSNAVGADSGDVVGVIQLFVGREVDLTFVK